MAGRDRSAGDRGGPYKGHDKGHHGSRSGGSVEAGRIDQEEATGRRRGKEKEKDER